MAREISIYDIQTDIGEYNQIIFKNKTKLGSLVFNYDQVNFDDITDRILSFGIENKLYDKMKLEQLYYLIEEDPWNIVGVICLNKGYTFIDVAEHNDRVVIKSAFHNKRCNVVGESLIEMG